MRRHRLHCRGPGCCAVIDMAHPGLHTVEDSDGQVALQIRLLVRASPHIRSSRYCRHWILMTGSIGHCLPPQVPRSEVVVLYTYGTVSCGSCLVRIAQGLGCATGSSIRELLGSRGAPHIRRCDVAVRQCSGGPVRGAGRNLALASAFDLFWNAATLAVVRTGSHTAPGWLAHPQISSPRQRPVRGFRLRLHDIGPMPHSCSAAVAPHHSCVVLSVPTIDMCTIAGSPGLS